MRNKWFSLLDLYFLVISIIWLVWWLIWWGVALYAYIDSLLITNEEYLSRNYYQIEACETDDKYIAPETQAKPKTDEEIKQCKDKAQNKIISERKYQFKQDVIWWVVWGGIFLLMFLIHFPFFVIRTHKKEDNQEDVLVDNLKVETQPKSKPKKK